MSFKKKNILNFSFKRPLLLIASCMSLSACVISPTLDIKLKPNFKSGSGLGLEALEINSTDSIVALKDTWKLKAKGGKKPYSFGTESGLGIIDSEGLFIAPAVDGALTKVYVEDADKNRVYVNITAIETVHTLCTQNSNDGKNQGVLLDPGGNSNYENNKSCLYTIDSGGINPVSLHFDEIALENNLDFVKIYNGSSTTDPQIANLTGPNLPTDVIASSGKMTILFTSDAAGVDTGFKAKWSYDKGPLSLTSSSLLYSPGDTISLTAAGGQGPYEFSLLSGTGSLFLSTTDSYRAFVVLPAQSQTLQVKITDALGASTFETFTVKPTVQFIGSNLTVAEVNGTATLTVESNGISETIIPYTISGTATNPADHNAVNGQIVIPSGQSSATLTINLVNDGVFEQNETIIVTLGSSSSFLLGATTSRTITIADTYVSQFSLDTTFNTVGYFSTAGTNTAQADYGFGVKVDSLGRVVMTGMIYNNGTAKDMFVWRLLDNGTPDTAFATAGKLTYNLSPYDWGHDLVILANDKIVINGYVDYGNDDPTLWKLNTNGTYDTTFNGTGMTRLGYGVEVESSGVALNADGSYIVVGNQYGNWAVVGKFTAAGAVDGTFGAAGKREFHNFPSSSSKVAIDSLGRIVVVGSGVVSGTDSDLVVWRYLSNGTLDTSFNGTGYFTHDGAAGVINSSDNGSDIVIDSSNNIYITGSSHNGIDTDMVVWKISGATGTLDSSFNGTGIMLADGIFFGKGNDSGNAITIEPVTNKLLIAGSGQDSNNKTQMVVWRVLTSGSLDTSFSSTGYFTHDVGNGYNAAIDITVDASGRILVSGHATITTSIDAVVWRFTK
jgi:uncharacterized delta-60 repeat protein